MNSNSHVHRFSVGQLQTNCYLIEQSGKCLIIDPGDTADFLLEHVLRLHLTPQGILVTHGHFDHCMAAGEIQLSYDIPFYIHENDIFLIDRLKKTAKHFLDHNPLIINPINITPFSKGYFSLSPFHFQLILSPGHTPGSVCLYFEKEKALFTGDVLFADGVGSYDHSYSNKSQLQESVRKLLNLPEDVTIYPGHGQESSIGAARALLKET